MEQRILDKIDWQKNNGLIPAIIQDENTLEVLMLGYMNKEALQKTITDKKVFFFSRTRQRLWMKGESSGNVLDLKRLYLDCDNDSLLVTVLPKGPTCHRGTVTCFDQIQFNLKSLERIIQQRIKEKPSDSYTTKLLTQGIHRIAQKVGEEAIETIIAGLNQKQKLTDETADLLYHLLLFINCCGLSLREVECLLYQRHQKS